MPKPMQSRHLTALPSFADLPSPPDGSRFIDDLLRTLVIPTDDPIRPLALDLMHTSEKWNTTLPGPELDKLSERVGEIQNRVCEVHATTPGGVLWKLLEVLDRLVPDTDSNWDSTTYLIKSAADDLLEMERRRCYEALVPLAVAAE